MITSYLAANAVVIPATGWLVGLFGRKKFFLICTILFVVSSFLSGAAPDLTTLIIARIFQGLGGGPIIPLSQAILWEIFPFHQRGLAMIVEVEHPVRGRYLTVGNPVKLSASPTTIGPSPLLGQHREEILRELGYGDDDIGALARDGAI